MTTDSLRSCSCKDLAQMARSEGLAGWHSMRKDELVQALVKHSRRKQKSGPGSAGSRLGSSTNRSGNGPIASRAQERLSELRAKMAEERQLATSNGQAANGVQQDRLVVMVRDPYWLHANWEIAPRSVARAQSAMGQNWHSTRPILRVYSIASDGTSILDRDITIHGGVNHWYVDVTSPPRQYRMEIGYLCGNAQFYCLARSNRVTTPPSSTSNSVDENWVDIDENADRIFAMSGGYTPHGTSLELQELLEERLRRPMGTPMQTRYGSGATRVLANTQDLPFAVDAELLVYGVSHPNAHVTLQGEPVSLRPDGSFTVRMTLADRRQVIPVTASSPDGVEQRTIILAIERNTKVLERVVRDPGA
jgi:uncharacterized protein